YYEFLLNAHQNSNYLSLDELRFYVTTSTTPDPTSLDTYDGTSLKLLDSKTPTFTGLSPVYDLDGGADPTDATSVKINTVYNSGTGRPDLYIDVPRSLFGLDLTQYVYVYAKLGVQNAADSTPEAFAFGNGAPVELSGQVATVIDEVSPTPTVGV